MMFCSKLSCEPLVLPGYKEGVIIQPGLFKGTYGDHGLEVVLLTYEEDDSSAVITKITVSTVAQASNALLTSLVLNPIRHSQPLFGFGQDRQSVSRKYCHQHPDF